MDFLIVIVIGVAFMMGIEFLKVYFMPPDKQAKYLSEKQEEIAKTNYGSLNEAMMCPHCQTNGKIRTKHVVQKKGVSGGKAVAGILTGGISLLAVGLSRKEGVTQAHCDNCNNTWVF